MKLKSLAHMCVHVDVLLSMAVQQQQMDLKLKPLAHMCVHVDVLLSMAVQQQQWT